jgi:hypothetical protein
MYAARLPQDTKLYLTGWIVGGPAFRVEPSTEPGLEPSLLAPTCLSDAWQAGMADKTVLATLFTPVKAQACSTAYRSARNRMPSGERFPKTR